MKKKTAFIYHPDELQYQFHKNHPFNQKRLELTVDLLKQTDPDTLSNEVIMTPRIALEEELSLVHTPNYIEAVQALSESSPQDRWLKQADQFGLGQGDTPFFRNMHEVTAHVVGGSIQAAELVMSGHYKQALHLGGGLHHAHPNKASGFCVYNDASVAIAYLKCRYQAKVLYIDTDVHHGDGVQFSFYSDPDVFNFSIHETGKFLFPGLGGADERGLDQGFSTTLNMPMEPYSEDESWLECFETPLRKIMAAFKPDVIVSQHGCDAHAYDPLSHQHCSMNIYLQMPKIIQELADEYCSGRWIALGGGGYDIWRVVPRAWSLLWLTMTNHPLVHELQQQPQKQLSASWLKQWQSQAPVTLPGTWLDPVEHWKAMPRRSQISEINKQMMEVAMMYLPK